MRVTDMPEIFQIEITSVCNMRCTFCPHPDMARDKKHMSKEVFAEASKYFISGQVIGLYMMGDPLLHPNLIDFIEIAKRKGCKPEIATNSLAFRGSDHIRAILQSGLSYVILDMSRWKERPDIMDRAYHNIQLLLDHYTAYNKSLVNLPTIALQLVNKSGSTQAFPTWALVAAERNPGKVLLKRKFLDTWAGQMKELYDFTDVLAPPERKPCHEPFERVAVLQNGDVVPCCRDAEGLTVYGNIMQQDLKEIWHGEVVGNVRNLMLASKNDKLPEPCRSCDSWHIPMNRHVASQDGSDEGKDNL